MNTDQQMRSGGARTLLGRGVGEGRGGDVVQNRSRSRSCIRGGRDLRNPGKFSDDLGTCIRAYGNNRIADTACTLLSPTPTNGSSLWLFRRKRPKGPTNFCPPRLLLVRKPLKEVGIGVRARCTDGVSRNDPVGRTWGVGAKNFYPLTQMTAIGDGPFAGKNCFERQNQCDSRHRAGHKDHPLTLLRGHAQRMGVLRGGATELSTQRRGGLRLSTFNPQLLTSTQ